MGAGDPVVVGEFLELDRLAVKAPQLGQVEHLYAVAAGVVRNDVGEVSVHLDVPPQRPAGVIGALQAAQPNGLMNVGDIDE